MVEFILFFMVIQFINVVLNTLRLCITAKGNKIGATIITAICYGFYTFVIVYTTNDFNIWIKVAITVTTNLVGVYLSMMILERIKKDRLWEIIATVKYCNNDILQKNLVKNNISYNFQQLSNSKDYIFHLYSHNKNESLSIKKELQKVNAKYIVHEETVKL